MPDRKILIVLWFVIACVATGYTIVACTPAKMIWHNYSDLTDYKIFPSRLIHQTDSPFRFQTALHRNTFGDSITVTKFSSEPFTDAEQVPLHRFLHDMQTVAFLIIKDDVVIMEKYFVKYTENAIIPSFSVAKSFVSALIGIAIAEHDIQSVHQSITDFIPELREKGFENITIEHLLQMTSGIKFSQKYDTYSDVAKFYYTSDILRLISKLKIKDPPGTTFHYKSVDTQLLGIILARATGKPLAQYLEEKIWHPLGMEYNASWSLDRKDGVEKAFCCLNARARDFAKFGHLYLHNGNWNGQQIVPEAWVRQSTQVDTRAGSVWWYQYQWRLASETDGDFYAAGLHGQYIYVNPHRNMIIVKFSKRSIPRKFLRSFFRELAVSVDIYLSRLPRDKEGESS